jgi:ferredoxin
VNLFNIADKFAALDRSDVTLEPGRCLHSQYRFSDCAACADICPVNAISKSKPPTLDSKACQGCLACLPVCPVGAFAADDAVAPLLNAVTHLEGRRLELLCDRNPRAELGFSENSTGIRVRGCLAGLGSGTYLALAAFGLEHIQVRTDACSACHWEALGKQVEAQVSQAKQLLGGWGKGEILDSASASDTPVERPLWKASNPPLSRRDLFLMAARQGQIAIARSIEDGQPRSGHRPGRDRRRILGAVAHLPAPASTDGIRLDGLEFATLSVSGSCTACGACARACPTAALQYKRNENETTFTLSLSARNCIGCGICTHVCAPASITIDRDPTFATVFEKEWVNLREGALVKCEQCGVLIAAQPDVHLCTFCDFRKSHPFGSMQMPGMLDKQPPVSAENGV